MSPHPPRPLFRTSRAVVFTTVCVTLATLGHSLTSTAAIPYWAVVAGFGGVLAVTQALAGHERSLPTLLGGLLGGQFALHSLYASAECTAATATAAGHHTVAVAPGPGGGGGSGTAMTLAHVAAAVVSAWWLRRGERAAWSLARRIATAPARVLIAIEPAAAPPRTAPLPAEDIPARPCGRILRHEVVRRGPPRRSRALALAC
ncbi:hypothetical protein [Spirillospora sp. NPDC029432]|uniref:hypothetical protein n=1 Tax=Spirillospora sp. NPDC029432 TaxID=3154599 RepID=UPI003451C36C